MRILLITYYFPPCGGAPVQRWLRFLPQLIQRGYEVSVLCSEDGDYPFLDKALLQKIPPKVKVIRAKAPGLQKRWGSLFGKGKSLPYGRIPTDGGLLTRCLVWMRLNLIVPDLRVFWNPSAWRAAKRELNKVPYDMVITTGPPHSSHLLGIKLRKKFGLLWFADFRDPWSGIHYLQLSPPSKLSMWLHRRLEAKVLRDTDAALVVSQAIADGLPPGVKHVILNGYNPKDFSGLRYRPADRFRIKYVGQVTAGQDPGIIVGLCKALRRDFRFSLIGTNLNPEEATALRQSCGNLLQIKPFMNHREALREMVEAELLVLLVNDYEGNSGMLTTKLFEYLASGTPILCFSPGTSAAARILQTIDGAKVFAYHDIAAAATWVDSLVSGSRTKGNIDSYSIDIQADKLDNALRGQICH
jgi:glycosyltransferase involved in cell wall biosynthesis